MRHLALFEKPSHSRYHFYPIERHWFIWFMYLSLTRLLSDENREGFFFFFPQCVIIILETLQHKKKKKSKCLVALLWHKWCTFLTHYDLEAWRISMGRFIFCSHATETNKHCKGFFLTWWRDGYAGTRCPCHFLLKLCLFRWPRINSLSLTSH